MPKSKKRKTNHQPSKKANDDLSHAEIWDDSALIRSWNDALAEYEFYHSIHAKGEDVEEILRKAEMAEDEAEEAPATVNGHEDGGLIQQDRAAIISEAKEDDDFEEGEVDDDDDDNKEEIRADAIGKDQIPIPDRDEHNHRETLVSNHHPSLTTPTIDTGAQHPADLTAQLPSSPTTAVGNADQTLENVKMAYYWAGYYSGLYDGQRQSQTKSQTQTQGPS